MVAPSTLPSDPASPGLESITSSEESDVPCIDGKQVVWNGRGVTYNGKEYPIPEWLHPGRVCRGCRKVQKAFTQQTFPLYFYQGSTKRDPAWKKMCNYCSATQQSYRERKERRIRDDTPIDIKQILRSSDDDTNYQPEPRPKRHKASPKAVQEEPLEPELSELPELAELAEPSELQPEIEAPALGSPLPGFHNVFPGVSFTMNSDFPLASSPFPEEKAVSSEISQPRSSPHPPRLGPWEWPENTPLSPSLEPFSEEAKIPPSPKPPRMASPSSQWEKWLSQDFQNPT